MKINKSFRTGIAVLAMVILLPLAVTAQTSPPPTHLTFMDSVTGYFSTFNPALELSLPTHKGTLWAGQDWQNGAHASTSLGIEYIFWKKISFDSESRFEDVTGNLKNQQLGIGYNVDVHDVRITGYIAAILNFDHAGKTDPGAVLGLRLKKMLTEHTFGMVGLAIPLTQQKTQPRFEIGTGFVF